MGRVAERVLIAVLGAVLLFGCELFDHRPPGEVTSLAATPGDTQVSLTWTRPADKDLDHCELWYGTDDNPATQFSGTADGGGTVVSGLTNGAVYSFLVKTVDGAGNTSAGSTVVATPVQPDIEIAGNWHNDTYDFDGVITNALFQYPSTGWGLLSANILQYDNQTDTMLVYWTDHPVISLLYEKIVWTWTSATTITMDAYTAQATPEAAMEDTVIPPNYSGVLTTKQ